MRVRQSSFLPALIALALGAGGVGATETEQEKLDKLAEEYNAKVESEDQEVVCRMVSEVGSRIKKKQCRTKAQIKQDEEEAARYARKPKQSFKSN
jgi:hypothetical protein